MNDYRTRDFVLRQYEGVTVVRFTAQNLTAIHDLDRIAAELAGLVERGTRKLVIDFKYVKYISSAALGMLIQTNKQIADAGGKLILSHTENIAELLRVSRTDKLFKTAPGAKEAVGMFD